MAWHELVYSPVDNGRRVLNEDLWVADLIYLMMALGCASQLKSVPNC